MIHYKTHLEIPYPEVERYADKNGLNIETPENFREARIALFEELTFTQSKGFISNEKQTKVIYGNEDIVSYMNEQKNEVSDNRADTFTPVKVGLNQYEDKVRLAFGNLTFFFPREQASIVASELIKLGDHKPESKEGEGK
jgi:hypothetical protein